MGVAATDMDVTSLAIFQEWYSFSTFLEFMCPNLVSF